MNYSVTKTIPVRRSSGFSIASVTIFALVAALATPAFAGPKGSTTICHIPPGDPGNVHTITVSMAALPAHVGHGDTIGECASTCVGNGTACSDDESCCSGYCGDGECATPCVENGSACGSAGECCSGSCSEGMCVTPCGQTGAACNDGAQCCTGNCENGACVAACTGNGDACGSNDQCCSGNCQSGTCAAACSTNGNGCTSNADCCSGICGAEGVCAAACTVGLEGGGAYCDFDTPCCSGLGVCFGGSCWDIGVSCQPYTDAPCHNDTLPCCFDNTCDDATHTCKYFP